MMGWGQIEGEISSMYCREFTDSSDLEFGEVENQHVRKAMLDRIDEVEATWPESWSSRTWSLAQPGTDQTLQSQSGWLAIANVVAARLVDPIRAATRPLRQTPRCKELRSCSFLERDRWVSRLLPRWLRMRQKGQFVA